MWPSKWDLSRFVVVVDGWFGFGGIQALIEGIRSAVISFSAKPDFSQAFFFGNFLKFLQQLRGDRVQNKFWH